MQSGDSGQDSGNAPASINFTLTLKEAAYQACRSCDTVARWCRGYGIGRQLHPNAPWRVDPVGLAIVIAADPEALAAYQARNWENPLLAPYIGEAI